MIKIEHAKLVPVSGKQNKPETDKAIEVQFNPASLKVALSNKLAEPKKNSKKSAAQFVDKSSSELQVELIFDTTRVADTAADKSQDSDSKRLKVSEGQDVRLLTSRIAEQFMKPRGKDPKKLEAPKRCQFQWGSFEFVGLVESFDETLDFFSPEGRPLRATVALKLKEDRFQFTADDSKAPERKAPDFKSGNNPGGPINDSHNDSGKDPADWRETALFNGCESARSCGLGVVAVSSVSLSASVGVSASASVGVSVGGGISASASISASAGVSLSAGANASTGAKASPAFKFGNSASLGSNIPGAFSVNGPGLSAASLSNGSSQLRSGEESAVKHSSGITADGFSSKTSIGFD